jgi:hypothetical protein
MMRRFGSGALLAAAVAVPACSKDATQEAPTATQEAPTATQEPTASSRAPVAETPCVMTEPSPGQVRWLAAIRGERPPLWDPEEHAKSHEVVVDRGTTVTLEGGAEVSLIGGVAGHLENSGNLALARVVVRRNGQTSQLDLRHTMPGPICYARALGLWIGLRDVDAYNQPVCAVLRIGEERPGDAGAP